MRRVTSSIAGILLLVGQMAVAAPSDEVTFKTAKKAPSGFDNQTIVIKLRVDKGKITFDPNTTFRFEFRTSIKAVRE
jgi:hypothetical protein